MQSRSITLTLVVVLGISACPAEDSGGDDAANDDGPADDSGSASNGMTSAGTATASDATEASATDPDTGAASCELTNIIPSPGLEGCFDCMTAMCCMQLQLCDQTQRCIDCLADPLDTEACVDPETFQSYPEYAGFASCQSQLCVPPCGLDGGSTCTAGDCAPECPNYESGCA